MLQRLYLTDIQDPKLLECLMYLIQAMALCKGDAPTEVYRSFFKVSLMDRQRPILGFRLADYLAEPNERQQCVEQCGRSLVAVEELGECRDLERCDRLL